jgi:hypothetical protein
MVDEKLPSGIILQNDGLSLYGMSSSVSIARLSRSKKRNLYFREIIPRTLRLANVAMLKFESNISREVYIYTQDFLRTAARWISAKIRWGMEIQSMGARYPRSEVGAGKWLGNEVYVYLCRCGDTVNAGFRAPAIARKRTASA